MPISEIRGTTIHYERAGHGPDLLFIHGMCGDARAWEGQVERLAGEYTCVTYDRRGHSRSPRGDLGESDTVHAEDAAALIEALGLTPMVVASSGGARIAVELVRRRPDLVVAAVLSEPPMLHLVPDAAGPFVADLRPRIEHAVADAGPEAAVDAFFDFVCPGLWSRLDEEAKGRYRANAPALFADLEAPTNVISPDDLAGIRTPVLLLSGADSHPVFHAITNVLAHSVPDVRVVKLADSGHVTYAEQPDAFAAAVTACGRERFTRTAPIER